MQMNALTHWIDGSMIYGSTEEEEERVVDRRTGFMRTSSNNLPPINRTIDCEARRPGTPCFVGGKYCNLISYLHLYAVHY